MLKPESQSGAILKQHDTEQISGLTTAARLWLTASVGVAVGLGRETSAILGTALTLIVLALLPRVRLSDAAHEAAREDCSAPSQAGAIGGLLSGAAGAGIVAAARTGHGAPPSGDHYAAFTRFSSSS